MSTEDDKIKNSTRRFNDENVIKRQYKIIKGRGMLENNKMARQPHRFIKRHALDCGKPQCALCGNPRHIHKDNLTAQEKRLMQDLDKATDKHSNGLLPNDED